jgi:hypothetical protein
MQPVDRNIAVQHIKITDQTLMWRDYRHIMTLAIRAPSAPGPASKPQFHPLIGFLCIVRGIGALSRLALAMLRGLDHAFHPPQTSVLRRKNQQLQSITPL